MAGEDVVSGDQVMTEEKDSQDTEAMSVTAVGMVGSTFPVAEHYLEDVLEDLDYIDPEKVESMIQWNSKTGEEGARIGAVETAGSSTISSVLQQMRSKPVETEEAVEEVGGRGAREEGGAMLSALDDMLSGTDAQGSEDVVGFISPITGERFSTAEALAEHLGSLAGGAVTQAWQDAEQLGADADDDTAMSLVGGEAPPAEESKVDRAPESVRKMTELEQLLSTATSATSDREEREILLLEEQFPGESQETGASEFEEADEEKMDEDRLAQRARLVAAYQKTVSFTPMFVGLWAVLTLCYRRMMTELTLC